MASMCRGVEGGSQKLINLLLTWSKNCIAGVCKLVQQGLAPVIAIGLLSKLGEEEEEEEQEQEQEQY